MSTRAAIAASIAYDTIMVFEGQFTDHILPDQIHKINLSFLSPKMRREYGGCAGNIAFNYALLGGEAVPMGMVGDDFGPYREHYQRCGIDQRAIRVAADSYTAQCFIVTDLSNNQLAGFHPGAMGRSAEIALAEAGEVAVGLVGPDAPDAMQQHSREMAEAGLPFILDPGQNIVLFSGEQLLEMIDRAPVLVCNDYEAELICDKTGLTLAQLAARVDTLIVTRGAEGSIVWQKGTEHAIAPVPAAAVKDPTGCGDAYRAGLIFGLMQGMDMATAGRIASLMGALKIEHLGPQNQRFDYDEFAEQFRQQFGYALR